MDDINPMIPHCSQHQTASVSETAYWIHGCIIRELDPGSAPDFAAKKTCWPNRGMQVWRQSCASIGPKDTFSR